MTDSNGNVTSLAYATVRPALHRHRSGRPSYIFAYTSPVSRPLSQVTGPGGRTVGYTYNSNGDLITITDVTGQPTSFTYDADHRLLVITDANGHTFIDNTYDTDCRVVLQRDAEAT